jgi:hypothetical protein
VLGRGEVGKRGLWCELLPHCCHETSSVWLLPAEPPIPTKDTRTNAPIPARSAANCAVPPRILLCVQARSVTELEGGCLIADRTGLLGKRPHFPNRNRKQQRT